MTTQDFNPGGATDLNDAVRRRAGLAAVASGRILGRVTGGAGAFEELTPAQVTAFLAAATTSLQGAMSAADKAKLDRFLGVQIALRNGNFF